MKSIKHWTIFTLLACSCADDGGYYPGWMGMYNPLGCYGEWISLTPEELDEVRSEYASLERSYTVVPEDVDNPEGPWMMETVDISIHPTFKHGRRFVPYVPQVSPFDETVACSQVNATKLQVELHSDLFTAGSCWGELTHYVADSKYDHTDWTMGSTPCEYAHLTYEETYVARDPEKYSLVTVWPKYVEMRNPRIYMNDQNARDPTRGTVTNSAGYGLSVYFHYNSSGGIRTSSIESGTLIATTDL